MKSYDVGSTQGTHTNFCFKKVSWSAIVVGALVATGLGFLLNLFNVGVGLSAFTTDPEGQTALAVGGLLWLILCAIVSMFIAGWVTGILAKPFCRKRVLAVMHAFAAWCLALVIAAILASHLSILVASGTQLIANRNAQAVIIPGYDRTEARPQINAERAANTLGTASLATFFIFLFGAASICLGGYLGAKQVDAECEEYHRRNV